MLAYGIDEPLGIEFHRDAVFEIDPAFGARRCSGCGVDLGRFPAAQAAGKLRSVSWDQTKLGSSLPFAVAQLRIRKQKPA